MQVAPAFHPTLRTPCDALSAPVGQPIHQPVTTHCPGVWHSAAQQPKTTASLRGPPPVAMSAWKAWDREDMWCSRTFLPHWSWITQHHPPSPPGPHTKTPQTCSHVEKVLYILCLSVCSLHYFMAGGLEEEKKNNVLTEHKILGNVLPCLWSLGFIFYVNIIKAGLFLKYIHDCERKACVLSPIS